MPLRPWLVTLTFAAAACSYDYTPPDTSGGYPSDKVLRAFNECVEERPSLRQQYTELTRGWSCFGDSDCERDTRHHYEWEPAGAPELTMFVMSDAHMLSATVGDGWHCGVRFWRRPDDAFLGRLAQLAEDKGLSRHESWSQQGSSGEVTWHVWRPPESEIPELRLIQQERPRPWEILYVE